MAQWAGEVQDRSRAAARAAADRSAAAPTADAPTTGARVPGGQGADPLHWWAASRSGESCKAAPSRSEPVGMAACRRSGGGRSGGGRSGGGRENRHRADRPATLDPRARRSARTARPGADGSRDDRPRGDGPAGRVGRRPTAVRAAASRGHHRVAVGPPMILGLPRAVRNHAADRPSQGHPALGGSRPRRVAGHLRLRVVVRRDAGRRGPGSGLRRGHRRADRDHLSGCRTPVAWFRRRRDRSSRRRSCAVPDAGCRPGQRPARPSSSSSGGACRVSSARLGRRQPRPASTSRRQR